MPHGYNFIWAAVGILIIIVLLYEIIIHVGAHA